MHGCHVPSVIITTQWAKKVKLPESGQIDWFDQRQRGLVLRVNAGGKKTWCIVYRVRGEAKKRRLTLDPFPAMTLTVARDKAKEVVSAAAMGNDPATDKQTRRKIERAAPTFAELANEFIDQKANSLRTINEVQRIIHKELIPEWGQYKARAIQRRDVLALTQKVIDRGARIMANRTFSLVRRIYNHGIKFERVDLNPTSGLTPPGGQEPSRDRVLEEWEIRQFWLMVDLAPMNESTRLAIKLILVTAQRPGEVARMGWDELQVSKAIWDIPGDRTKNEISHRVPLSTLAIQIIEQIPQVTRLLFPSPTVDKAINPNAMARAVSRYRRSVDAKHWTPHDLRRTAASKMASAGVERLVIKKILNHQESDITAVYERHSYDKEKREALELWGNMLQEMTRPPPGFEVGKSVYRRLKKTWEVKEPRS